MGLWALPMLVVFLYSVVNYEEVCPHYWLLVFPVGIGLFGVFLLSTAFRASDESVDKRLEWMSEGGEWIGIVFIIVVLIVAVPIWELLKLLRST